MSIYKTVSSESERKERIRAVQEKGTHNQDPTKYRKCPECNGRNYSISAPLENCWTVRNGKTINKRKGRYDAGGFWCDDCGYEQTL